MPWSLRMTLLVALGAVPFELYVISKGGLAAAALGGGDRTPVRPVILGIMLAVNLYPLALICSAVLHTQALNSALREGGAIVYWMAVYPFWAVMLLCVQAAPVLVCSDLVKLPLWRWYAFHREAWTWVESRLVLGLLVVGLLYVVGRIYWDTCRVRVTTLDLPMHHLPPELEGYRIVHISDLQADALTTIPRMRAYLDAVQRLQPQVVFFSGDLVTSGTAYIEVGASMLGQLRVPHGVIACLGDHDVWAGGSHVVAALQRQGIRVLENDQVSLEVGSRRLLVTGVTNVYRQRAHPALLQQLDTRRSDASLTVFMSHQPSPDVVEWAAARGYDLLLGGHTHGGQVVLRWPGLVWAPVLRETPYLAGVYRVGSMTVSVNNGLGLTLAPIRFQAPAEVTLIRLVRARKAG